MGTADETIYVFHPSLASYFTDDLWNIAGVLMSHKSVHYRRIKSKTWSNSLNIGWKQLVQTPPKKYLRKWGKTHTCKMKEVLTSCNLNFQRTNQKCKIDSCNQNDWTKKFKIKIVQMLFSPELCISECEELKRM